MAWNSLCAPLPIRAMQRLSGRARCWAASTEVAADLKSLSLFLTDRLMQVPGVSGVRSMICMEEIKPHSSLPT